MIIAIGGPSNAGKSSLASVLQGILGEQKSVVLCQDDFVFPKDTLPRIKDHIDWEHPGTIDVNRFKHAIELATNKYEYVIVEGFLVFAVEELTEIYQKNIFIELEEKTFLSRKRNDLRWGREPDWYITHIWRRFIEYGRPPEDLPVLILKGVKSWPIDRILVFLNKI